MSENNKSKENQKRQFDGDQNKMLLRCSEKQDMTEWNDWRKDNINVQIFLQEALFPLTYLEGANLREANLENAGLAQANLKRANFIKANLVGTDFFGANLKGARFEEANMEGANLREANLKGANLHGVNLEGVGIHGANLKGANLHEANLKGTNLSGANLEGVNLHGANLEDADIFQANLKGALLGEANLKGANLHGVNLEGVGIHGANLKGANLYEANLKGANLSGANLEGVNFHGANLKGTDFTSVVLDGKTLLWDCTINEVTDFTGTGLDSARVEPRLKVKLQGNIRRKQWKKWYEEGSPLIKRYKKLIVKPFWWVSDYGRSTGRIVGCFFGLSIMFALFYYFCGLIDGQGIIANLFIDHNIPNGNPVSISPYIIPVRAIYFSIVTMTTLGFGDMYAQPGSYLGHILLTIQVLLGYVLLGALVTRFAVLFTSSGPSQD